MNNYALLQDLLPVLAKHGLDVEADIHVDVRKPRARMLDRRGGPDRVVVEIRGFLQ